MEQGYFHLFHVCSTFVPAEALETVVLQGFWNNGTNFFNKKYIYDNYQFKGR